MEKLEWSNCNIYSEGNTTDDIAEILDQMEDNFINLFKVVQELKEKHEKLEKSSNV
jgi:Zn-dependent M32 family carboxypeptidase